MKKNLLIIAVCILACLQTLKAQDPQFSQFYAVPLYLNPAYAGSVPMHRLNLAHRIQWPNLPRAFNTTALSYDYNLSELNSGFGLQFTHDRAGAGNLVATAISGIYAYKIRFGHGWVASPGLQFGYVVRNLDYSRLLLHDQVSFGSSGQRPGTIDPVVRNIGKIHYFDFGTGLLLYNKTSWMGISVYHLNEPNQSLIGAEDRLAAKYSLHAGVRLPFYKGPLKRDQQSSLAPSFVYKRQGSFQQLDLGATLNYDPLIVGGFYRGMLLRDEYGYGKQDALVMLFGLRFPGFDVGYSYDFTISSMGPGSGGAHEISLLYLFNTEASRKVKRKDKFIPCPTFQVF
jgi:type IX secretion system PorP/SprF family membrane protein